MWSEFRALYDGDKTMQKVADIYEAYDQEKQKRLLMDFDDLLLEVYRLLNENELVREKYRGTFRHLLVDEYQDTNPVQMEILKILVNRSEEGASFWAMWRRLARVCMGSLGQAWQIFSTSETSFPVPNSSSST